MTNGLSPHRPGWHTLARLPCIPAAVLANLETNALRGLEPDVTLTTLKHLTLALAVAAALSACKKDDAAPAATAAAPAETPKLVIDESKLPKLPYFAATDLDANTPICQDLNGHVNGKWIAANPIPADKTSWGNFSILRERSLFVQQQIVEAAAAAKNAPGSNEQKLGDFYRLGLDDAKLNTDGITPLKPTLAKIDALVDGAGVAQYLVDSFSHGDQFVFGFGAAEDFKNASQVIAYANEGGLSLPERA